MSNKKERALVLDARIDDFDFLLINIYNAYTKKKQISVFNVFTKYYLILKISIIIMLYSQVTLFDASLDANGSTPTLKSWLINKLIELNETLGRCDIWRIRNPKKSKCTFQQKHLSRTIQQRLD